MAGGTEHNPYCPYWMKKCGWGQSRATMLSSHGPFPLEPHRVHLILEAMGRTPFLTCYSPGKPIKDLEDPRLIQKSGHTGTSAWHIPNFQTPEKEGRCLAVAILFALTA